MVRILCPARATLARHNDIKPYSDGVVRLTTAAVRPNGRGKIRYKYIKRVARYAGSRMPGNATPARGARAGRAPARAPTCAGAQGNPIHCMCDHFLARFFGSALPSFWPSGFSSRLIFLASCRGACCVLAL